MFTGHSPRARSVNTLRPTKTVVTGLSPKALTNWLSFCLRQVMAKRCQGNPGFSLESTRTTRQVESLVCKGISFLVESGGLLSSKSILKHQELLPLLRFENHCLLRLDSKAVYIFVRYQQQLDPISWR